MQKFADITSPTLPQSEIDYPESDGQPMGETSFHINAILYLYQALRHFFQQAEQTYVAANMFFYYEEGNTSANKAPDVFVVKGVSKHNRRTYKLWEEKTPPCTIIEITSRSTRLEDIGAKRGLYEFLGIREYILFDPLDEYLSPRLQGFHLMEEYYRPMELSPEGTLFSQELGVILKPDGALLRVVDPATGDVVPTLDEAMAEAARLRTELEQIRRLLGED